MSTRLNVDCGQLDLTKPWPTRLY